MDMLHDIMKCFSKNFQMKDMGEAYYEIIIEIFWYRSRGVLSLSQKGYINKILEMRNEKKCSVGIDPIK